MILPENLRESLHNDPTACLRNIIFVLFLLRWARRSIWKLRGRGILGTFLDLYFGGRRMVYGYLLRAPGVQGKVRRELESALGRMRERIAPRADSGSTKRHVVLPVEGLDDDTVRATVDVLELIPRAKWEDGKVSGAVYHGGEALTRLQVDMFARFAPANPIHPDVFPAVRQMDAEIVAMVLALFSAPPGAAGTTTSGGTESILLACLSAREKARTERGVTEPEMIIPETAHAAFHKAASYFNIHCHQVACPAPSYQVDVRAVARLINPNTVLLVGSAPNFPHGITDDIGELSRLALRRGGLPLHVDCCLGSFLVPMLERAGFEAPAYFDFRAPGVTSISCDTHKYGFAPKGNSTVLYRTAALRTYQYFVSPDWTGGVYASPGLAGSRPGALTAGCWATMISVGESGYVAACREIVSAARRLAAAVTGPCAVPALAAELEVVGRPLVSVVAFTAPRLSIYAVADAMSARGWHLNALQRPPALHVAITLPVARAIDSLVADLEAVVEMLQEREREREAGAKGGQGGTAAAKTGDMAVLYGVAGALPNKSVVVDLARGFLDLMFWT